MLPTGFLYPRWRERLEMFLAVAFRSDTKNKGRDNKNDGAFLFRSEDELLA